VQRVKEAFDTMRELNAPFTRSRDRLSRWISALQRMTKYASNAMWATKISLMN